jgi:DNA-binding NarL/FixJ family response regulator
MKILIADDHPMIVDSLRCLLEDHGHEVVATANNGATAVSAATSMKPDIALLDISMPVMNGIDATRKIIANAPGTKVVLLTGNDDERLFVTALDAGASGYLLKDLKPEKFVTLLESATDGDLVLSPKLTQRVLELLSRSKQANPDALTEREQEVMRCMTEGITSNRKLASTLGVSENTVKFHVRNILDKLHVNSRAQAVGLALRNHLIEDPTLLPEIE